MAEIQRDGARSYPPDYVSVETLAYRLDCTVGEVESLLRNGVIPAPIMLAGLRRWDFGLVRATIEGQAGRMTRVGRNGRATAADDPYLAGVERGPTR